MKIGSLKNTFFTLVVLAYSSAFGAIAQSSIPNPYCGQSARQVLHEIPGQWNVEYMAGYTTRGGTGFHPYAGAMPDRLKFHIDENRGTILVQLPDIGVMTLEPYSGSRWDWISHNPASPNIVNGGQFDQLVGCSNANLPRFIGFLKFRAGGFDFELTFRMIYAGPRVFVGVMDTLAAGETGQRLVEFKK